jgi:lipopolysaccharide export LptBFGC system permease protein LptF
MKKIIAILTAVLFVFAIATVAIAAEEKKAPVAEKKADVKKAETKKADVKKVATVHKQITGEVKAVDALGKNITVVKKGKDKAEEVIIAVDDKQLASVKAGDKITVKYTVADNKNTAKSITPKVDKKAPKKAETVKPAEPVKPVKAAEPVKPATPVKK